MEKELVIPCLILAPIKEQNPTIKKQYRDNPARVEKFFQSFLDFMGRKGSRFLVKGEGGTDFKEEELYLCFENKEAFEDGTKEALRFLDGIDLRLLMREGEIAFKYEEGTIPEGAFFDRKMN